MEETNDESEMLSGDHASNIIGNVQEAKTIWQDDLINSTLSDDFSFSQEFIENDAQQKVQNLTFVAYSNQNSIPSPAM